MKSEIVKISFLIFLSSYAMMFYCGEKTENNKNMKQHYAEKGVPVEVRKIKKKPFEIKLYYTAELSGYKETSAYASITDKIDKIHHEVGDWVKKDDIIISFPQDNPATPFYQAKKNYENTKLLFRRMSKLFDDGGISRQELDNVKTQFEIAKADWNSAKQLIHVKAPISGIITAIDVSVTDNTEPGKKLFTISRSDTLESKIWLTWKESRQVKPGVKATAKVDGQISLDGKIIRVDRVKHPDTQAFGVTIRFPNPYKDLLNSGTLADIEIQTYENPNAIVVNQNEIVKKEDKRFVFLAKDGKALKKEILIGKSFNNDFEIISGVSSDELLICKGSSLVDDKAKINIINR